MTPGTLCTYHDKLKTQFNMNTWQTKFLERSYMDSQSIDENKRIQY